MNSTQLIRYFNLRKEALGEKATDFNMFLEGYGVGIIDLDVRNAIVKETIDKACELLFNELGDTQLAYPQEEIGGEWGTCFVEDFIESFRKKMEK